MNFLILTLVVVSCAYPFAFMYDVYGTEMGGLRSKRKYQKYKGYNDSLPDYIKKEVPYTVEYSRNINTDKIYEWEEETGYIVFLEGSRAIEHAKRGATLSKQDFVVAAGNITYYKYSENERIVFSYAAANGGGFEPWLITPRSDSTFILQKKGSYDKYYYKISENIPKAWFTDLEVDW